MVFGIKTKSDVEKRCAALVKLWAPRNARFKEWYRLVQMIDELEQEDMESFVGNDPRAAYNLSLHMLDMPVPHRIPSDIVNYSISKAASEVEVFLSDAWADVSKTHRRSGKKSWQRDMIGLLLVTGWYSVFTHITDERCFAEVINPAESFPNWDDELVEHVRILNYTKEQAERMAIRKGWTKLGTVRGKIKGFDYWVLGDTVRNIVILDGKVVKDENEPDFTRIPIFVAPTGGLPDNGSISGSTTEYIKEMGQSSLATNENIYQSWNKWWTFSQQLLRDTAQPRWFEQSRSGQKILRPQDMFKRGAIFRGTPEDSISPIPTPPLPIELRTTQIDMESMMQRGGMSWAVYGNVQQNLTAYVMAQITASASQVLRPFHSAIIDLYTDIDNFWMETIRNRGYSPYGFKVPKEITPSMQVSAEYDLSIPGDLVQRATTARMLDPEFRLSYSTVMAELFPNIKNPAKELAQARADIDQLHPINVNIAMIEVYRAQAAILRKSNNVKSAELYEKAAAMIEAQMTPQEQQQQPSPGGGPIVPRTEIAPRTTSAPPGTIEPEAGGIM